MVWLKKIPSLVHFFTLNLSGFAAWIEIEHTLKEMAAEVQNFAFSFHHGLFLISMILLLKSLGEFCESVEKAEGFLETLGLSRLVQGLKNLKHILSQKKVLISMGFILMISSLSEVILDLQESLAEEAHGLHWGVFLWGAGSLIKGSLGLLEGLHKIEESHLVKNFFHSRLFALEKFLKSSSFDCLLALALVLVAVDSIVLESLTLAQNFWHSSFGMIALGFNELIKQTALILKSVNSFFSERFLAQEKKKEMTKKEDKDKKTKFKKAS